jgi:hypothetical protein
VAAYRHAKLSAIRMAGEIKHAPADGATLDELLERIRRELTKLGPILDLEVARESEGSRTEGGLTLALKHRARLAFSALSRLGGPFPRCAPAAERPLARSRTGRPL